MPAGPLPGISAAQVFGACWKFAVLKSAEILNVSLCLGSIKHVM